MSRTCQCSLTPLAKLLNYLFHINEDGPCTCCCRQDMRREKEPDTPPLLPITRQPPPNFLPLPPNNFLPLSLTHQQGDEGEGESIESNEGEGESDESYESWGDENV